MDHKHTYYARRSRLNRKPYWTLKRTVFVLLVIFSMTYTIVDLFGFNKKPVVEAKQEAPFTSPVPEPQVVVQEKIVYKERIIYTKQTTKHESEQDAIEAYIAEVFGDDADKAIQLLTVGNPDSISCPRGENRELDPEAVNTAGNTPKGSRDIGVFQINEYWQQVQGKYLFNWKINVEIAKQIFDENGGSFKMWTCGKAIGI